MSGFEVVGIVFGVLPLFIEAGKHSATTASRPRWAIGSAKSQQKLKDFYDEFYCETYEINKQIETIIHSLPKISKEYRGRILKNREVQTCLDSWHEISDIAKGLKDLFGNEADLYYFRTILEKVLGLFCRILEDETVNLSREQNFGKMTKKMKAFQSQPEGVGRFWERYRFLSRESRRDTCIKSLRIWRKKLGSDMKPISLRALFNNTRQPNILPRRRLALKLACAVLQLHENVFSDANWTEEFISFFVSELDDDPINHPSEVINSDALKDLYIESSFTTAQNLSAAGSESSIASGVFHSNADILRLGSS
ncbi:hypothetical protein QBC38DRAFT_516510 [Podospora fimiseda]|uniref:Uncharacterized protein n=1 Tax=Podospora fimiseda TaxID=252190 RepID=A0AAN7BHS8_9PEZI|nr:hypothetical protein QBC38DRAFT_516510 [Podospora fimiseda]